MWLVAANRSKLHLVGEELVIAVDRHVHGEARRAGDRERRWGSGAGSRRKVRPAVRGRAGEGGRVRCAAGALGDDVRRDAVGIAGCGGRIGAMSKRPRRVWITPNARAERG